MLGMINTSKLYEEVPANNSNHDSYKYNLEKINEKIIGDKDTLGNKSESKNFRNITPVLIWDKKVPNTELEKFKVLIQEKYNQHFDSYWDLHKWSIDNFANFWEEIWNYFGMITSSPYEEVYRKTGDGFLDCEWFNGTRFNFAENILRIRDDRVAIICADERGNEENITFSEMFEEVKLYAAAFRKHGLQKGDRIACYMSNRKEAVYAFLAATSIGAVFGGPQPFLGGVASTNIIRKMEPKFLITIDVHTESTNEYRNIDTIQDIADKVPSLEKILVVATMPETKFRDFSNIKNSCLLEDFLNSAITPDGVVPDLVFEQLPFDHPISINFTSGTTGLPKGPVHSAGTLISHLTSVVFYWNLKCGDVIYTCYPCGWTLWDTFIPCLSRGVTLFLYAGCPYNERQGANLWDLFAQFKVTYAFLATTIAERWEKMNAVPSPNSNLDKLRIVTMGGCPVNAQTYLYVHNKVKTDMFVCSQYGASESFGTFSGFDLNMPCHAGEIQAPGLGMDVQCFDEEGNSVVNMRGEMVLATPTPSLPVTIWKDENNKIMKETYLNKYPGVWCQNDEIWINPKTKGIVVIGRSDDTLTQNGERFGAGDIYSAIHDVEDIRDYICVGQNRDSGACRAVLFVKMKEGRLFTAEFEGKLRKKIEEEIWFDCVPEVILETKDIPYNLNNKKMERIIRIIVSTNQIPEVSNIKNPECLKYFCDIPELVEWNTE